MKTILIVLLPLSFLGFYFLSPNDSCCESKKGRCTGSAYCTACTNCKYCAHCNSGGSCGVCSGRKSYPAPKYKPKKTPVYTSPQRRKTTIYVPSATQKAIDYHDRYDFESRKNIEQFLNNIGLLSLREVDGFFNSNTIESIKRFQRKVGIKADGCFGPGTLRKAEDYVGG